MAKPKTSIQKRTSSRHRQSIFTAYEPEIYQIYRQGLIRRMQRPGVVMGEAGSSVFKDVVARDHGLVPGFVVGQDESQGINNDSVLLFLMFETEILRLADEMKVCRVIAPTHFPVLVISNDEESTLVECYKGN